ncbi:MAG: 6-phosphogluconolactonase [Bacteroidales bacterium]
METLIRLSRNQFELAGEFAECLSDFINLAAKRKKPVNIALSGGTTPGLLFSMLGDLYSKKTDWEYVHFFWGDERCVPPHDQESNYGLVRLKLLEKISIPPLNIHRIRGESDPVQEAQRYAGEIMSSCRGRNGLPVFDMILLGLGEDGHTASIFPGNESSFSSKKVCEVAVHPLSGQKRITITGSVINNADRVIFLVTGASKADIISQVIECPGISEYPAANVEPLHGTLEWYLDNDAASSLSQWA